MSSLLSSVATMLLAHLAGADGSEARAVAVTADSPVAVEIACRAGELIRGSLAPDQFERWVVAPNSAIADALRERHPGVPVIGFPKGAGAKLVAYARETGVDAVGLDETIDPAWAMRELPERLPVQGNLDPLLLLAGGEALEQRAEWILEAFAGRPHVFNLGHGIDKETPIAHVERLLEIVRQPR